MERLQTFMDFIRSNPRWNIFVIAITTLAISVDIFYQSNGAGTLDWNDWLFWAKQNYEKIISSQNLFTMVISPVQGLFGLSYPLNPFFNPLWLIAVLIDETTTAHRLTTAIIFDRNNLPFGYIFRILRTLSSPTSIIFIVHRMSFCFSTEFFLFHPSTFLLFE